MTEAELEALLGRARARAAGLALPDGSADPKAELLAAVAASEVTVEALSAKRAALRAVARRCVVSAAQAAFLDEVLAAVP